MRMLLYGVRNAFRNRVRLAVVTALIAIPFFLLLLMQALGAAVSGQLDQLQRNVNNTLQVRASGSMGHVNMVGSDALLPPDALAKVRALEHVANVEPYLLAMDPMDGGNFAMVVGLRPGDTKRLESHGEAGTPRILAGRDLTPFDAGQPVGVIGQRYARWFGIDPADFRETEITLDPRRSNAVIYALRSQPKRIRVVGVYASGYVFGDLQLFIPIDTFRDIYPANGISWLFVTVDQARNVPAVERGIREVLGPGADIIAPKSSAAFESTAADTLNRITGSGLLLALLLAGIVVFFTMTLVAGQRVREVGTLKALGASGAGIVAQFVAEAMTLAALGAAAGLGLFALLSGVTARKAFALTAAPFLPAEYRDTLFETLEVSAGAGPGVLALLVLSALVVAALGTLYAAWTVARLSPVEALRDE